MPLAVPPSHICSKDLGLWAMFQAHSFCSIEYLLVARFLKEFIQVLLFFRLAFRVRAAAKFLRNRVRRFGRHVWPWVAEQGLRLCPRGPCRGQEARPNALSYPTRGGHSRELRAPPLDRHSPGAEASAPKQACARPFVFAAVFGGGEQLKCPCPAAQSRAGFGAAEVYDIVHQLREDSVFPTGQNGPNTSLIERLEKAINALQRIYRTEIK